MSADPKPRADFAVSNLGPESPREPPLGFRNCSGSGCVGGGVMVGKRGRVIGRIAPGIVGEVMLPIRGATEAFYAYPATDEVIEVGTPIVVVEFDPPRTVYVSRAF